MLVLVVRRQRYVRRPLRRLRTRHPLPLFWQNGHWLPPGHLRRSYGKGLLCASQKHRRASVVPSRGLHPAPGRLCHVPRKLRLGRRTRVGVSVLPRRLRLALPAAAADAADGSARGHRALARLLQPSRGHGDLPPHAAGRHPPPGSHLRLAELPRFAQPVLRVRGKQVGCPRGWHVLVDRPQRDDTGGGTDSRRARPELRIRRGEQLADEHTRRRRARLRREPRAGCLRRLVLG